jgi:enhancing lycopene biosynthesis protein 2
VAVFRPTLPRVPPSRNLREAISDPGAAAARGRWLARGAWLLAAGEVVIAVRNHLTGRLTDKERKRMVEIVRSSKGRPSNLSNRERRELRSLLDKVEPRELANKVATSGFASRFAKGMRRK